MFEKAIEDLFSSKEIVSNPIPFQPYISQIGLKNIKTADFISINDISQLRPELKENKCTVLRLGAGERGYTRFALVQMDSWDDYFLREKKLFHHDFSDEKITVSKDFLLPFKMVENLSETALVNLCLGSGILYHALELDDKNKILPFTTRGSYTFNFKPSNKSKKILEHVNGQIEIDSMFVAKRNGKKSLFVVEAKSDKTDNLSKHKIFYPILAISKKIPSDLDVVPVYIRIKKNELGYSFHIAECSISKKDDDFGALSEVKPNKIYEQRIKLESFA